MIDIEVKLTGDITASLDRYLQKVQGEVVLSGVAAMAKVLYDEVKLNTSGVRSIPRDPDFVGPMRPSPPGKVTGNLHNAIYRVYAKERSQGDQKVYKVSVNKSKAPHWHWLEYGNSRMAMRPYIRPALSKLDEAVNAGQDRMRERLSQGGSAGSSDLAG